MTNKFSINVSGGNLSLGTAVQGNGNSLSSSLNSAQTAEMVETSSAEVLKIGSALKLPEDQLQDLRTALEQIQTELKKANPSATSATGPLKTIRDNFSWAYPLLKDSIAIAWPALLAAIAA